MQAYGISRKLSMSKRRKVRSPKDAPLSDETQFISWAKPPEPVSFKCPCDGENPNCVHCNGSGLTSRQVELRSKRTLSLEHTSAEPFRSKRERLFEIQVSSELRNLRDAYLRQEDESQVVFFSYLRRLAVALDKTYSQTLVYWLPELWGDGDLSSLASRLDGGSKVGENVRILAKAARACLEVIKSARAEKKAAGKGPQQARKVVERDSQLLRCPHCGTMIYDQGQHNILFHQGQRGRSKSVKPPKRDVQAPSIKQLAVKLVPTARVQAAKSKPPKPDHTNKGLTRPVHPHVNDLDRAQADTSPVERDMEARRTWGGRFRDTNGTFGSHPLHDSMDDESNAG